MAKVGSDLKRSSGPTLLLKQVTSCLGPCRVTWDMKTIRVSEARSSTPSPGNLLLCSVKKESVSYCPEGASYSSVLKI